MGGGDFIAGDTRYCLWLVGANPAKLRALPNVMARIEAVKKFRLESKAESTRKYAVQPTLFRQIAQPDSGYLAVPEVSSEKRSYIPIAFLTQDVICSNTIQFVPSATLWNFGVLTSTMHMAWVKQVCGRLKSDYRYSNSLVYNNFPWPQAATDKHKAAVEACAQAVLDARAPHLAAGSTLADLYDPLTMPPELVKAHQALDRAVEKCYSSEKTFQSDRDRTEHLFKLYETLTAGPLEAGMATKPKRRKK
jgi:hypothetical protein